MSCMILSDLLDLGALISLAISNLTGDVHRKHRPVPGAEENALIFKLLPLLLGLVRRPGFKRHL